VCAQSNVLMDQAIFPPHVYSSVQAVLLCHWSLTVCTAEIAVETNRTEEHLLYTNHGLTASVVVHV